LEARVIKIEKPFKHINKDEGEKPTEREHEETEFEINSIFERLSLNSSKQPTSINNNAELLLCDKVFLLFDFFSYFFVFSKNHRLENDVN
jgi:hypothetical protein